VGQLQRAEEEPPHPARPLSGHIRVHRGHQAVRANHPGGDGRQVQEGHRQPQEGQAPVRDVLQETDPADPRAPDRPLLRRNAPQARAAGVNFINILRA